MIPVIRNGRMPSPWQRYERQQQQQQASVTALKNNDIHRVLTPRVGQRKTAATPVPPRRRPNGKARGSRRRMRLGSRRKGDRLGRRRNTGARQKPVFRGNETCTCACQS